jgi:hypothetical protein
MRDMMSNSMDNPRREPVGIGERPFEPTRSRLPMNPIERPVMPMFHDGTDYVPHTGPAILEKGEAVIPKEKNMEAVRDVLGGHQPIKAHKRIKEMVHSKSHNGKHIIVHKHHSPHDHPSHDEVHALDNMSDVHDHMEAHAGTPNEGEQPESGSVPQMTPSPSPMGGMPPGV